MIGNPRSVHFNESEQDHTVKRIHLPVTKPFALMKTLSDNTLALHGKAEAPEQTVQALGMLCL